MAIRLKIGLVLDDSLDSTDGVQQYVLTLGSWLSAQGHDVHYLVGQTRRSDIPQLHSLARNWRVRFNGNMLSMPLPASKKRIRQLLQAKQFDVLHIQAPYSPLLAGRIIRQAKPTTVIIGSFHVLPYSRFVTFANRLLAIANRRSAKHFNAMIANSAPAKAFADATYGFSSIVVPNPFALSKFHVETPDAVTPTIVFLGRLVARKGAQQLLAAVRYMVEQKLYMGPFEVIIGGKGPMLAQLEAYTEKSGLSPQVSFVGFVAEADKAAFLAQADIAVFPSISGESFGISLLEALAAARGVVLGGDNPGYRSVLAPLSEDNLVQPNNTALFAQQLAYWLGNLGARQEASAKQKQYVKRFDIETVGPEIVKAYNRALRSVSNVR